MNAMTPHDPADGPGPASGQASAATEADYVRELRDLESYLNLEFGLVRGGLRPPLTLGGRFELRQLIGRGAKGLVCHARQLALGRDVALKLYPAGASERLIQSVAAEARALARFLHPAIVHVYSVEHADLSRGNRSVLYVEMELLGRGTLRDWLKQPRSVGEILDVFTAAGEGLAAAHELHLLHCDFKPDNLVFGADGRPRVVDFGLARATAEPAGSPAAGTLIGTPAYAAPESFHGDVSARSDQYSYAVTLWQALFGGFPYDETAADLRARSVLRDPPPRPDVPPTVVAALRRALSERPEQRYVGMRDLLQALRPPAPAPAPIAARMDWPSFTDERPDHHVRAGSIWPSVLGLVVIAVIAGGLIARQLELDGGWLDFTRSALAEPEQEPLEQEPAPLEPTPETRPPAPPIAPPVAPAPVTPTPVTPTPPPVTPTPPPATPTPATCPKEPVLSGTWYYDTAVVWSAHAELLDTRGKYSVEFAPAPDCALDTRVRKLSAGDAPPVDRVSLSPTIDGDSARMIADVRLAPRSDAELASADYRTDPAGLHYVFEYAVDGDRLLGVWRHMQGDHTVMLGVLRGGRREGTLDMTAALRDLPCSTQCAVRCPGDEARQRCEREQCAAAHPRIHDCGAPGLAFVPPPATLAINSPLSYFGRPAAPIDRCRAIADHLAGRWTIHAIATSEQRGRERTYNFRLRAEGCTLHASEARLGERDLSVSGVVRADGRWTLHYRGPDGLEGDWMLLGRDPAFGSFRARSGVQGTIAAYRTPP